MDRRVIIFSHVHSLEGSSAVVFGISKQALSATFQALTLNGFASANSLLRHEKFDFAAGDAGLKCALFEFVLKNSDSLSSELPNHIVFETGKQWVDWLNFPNAARALADGTDKRYLQLAVQYISAGGVDNSVVAADFDQAFLTELGTHLEKLN